jgi:hypothetical protein
MARNRQRCNSCTAIRGGAELPSDEANKGISRYRHPVSSPISNKFLYRRISSPRTSLGVYYRRILYWRICSNLTRSSYVTREQTGRRLGCQSARSFDRRSALSWLGHGAKSPDSNGSCRTTYIWYDRMYCDSDIWAHCALVPFCPMHLI